MKAAPLASLGLLLFASLSLAAPVTPVAQLAQAVPAEVQQYHPRVASEVTRQAEAVEQWAATITWSRAASAGDVLIRLEQLIQAHQAVESLIEQVLSQRGRFAALPADRSRAEALSAYLTTTSQLIDLSGRLRYLLRDAIDNASYALDPDPERFSALIDLLRQHRVKIGAAVMSYVLMDPPVESLAVPYPDNVRRKALELIRASRNVEVIPQLVEFIRQPGSSPELVLLAGEVLVELGLPQDPLPEQEEGDLPAPAITAAQLHRELERIDQHALDSDAQRRLQRLLKLLNQQAEKGVLEEGYRIGDYEVRSGDWLLMRNPSPYNLFTDLSPGLFTHVGVVTTTRDAQGRRHLVVVDLPERGDHIPATNVEIYLQRTLHYIFLRHEEPGVAAELGATAARIIGNPSQFDLLFRTDRVAQLEGQPLEGRNIHTYCAGLLLLCAQETDRERGCFFPIAEQPASQLCLDNLGKLGLSIGDNFVSPTGALFSPELEIVGRCEAMYEPGREIQEAIYDHFAYSMAHRTLRPSPTAYQALREKVAGLAKYNPWLATTLAAVNNVSDRMDLEAAAKAAAVVETLDQIARSQSEHFVQARIAFLAGPLEGLEQEGFSELQRDSIEHYRRQHTDLYQRWLAGELTPRQLRMQLVRYYVGQGRKELNERFFPEGS